MKTPRPATPPPRGAAIEHSVLVQRTEARQRELEKKKPVTSEKTAAQVSGDRRQGDGGELKPGTRSAVMRWIRKRPHTFTSRIWGAGYSRSMERGTHIGLSQAEKIRAQNREELVNSARMLKKRVDAVLDTSLEKHPDFNSRPGRAPISNRKRDWPRRLLPGAKTLKQLLKEDPNYAIRGSVGRNEASLNKSVAQRERLLTQMVGDKDTLELTQTAFESARNTYAETDQQFRAAQVKHQSDLAALAEARKPLAPEAELDAGEQDGGGDTIAPVRTRTEEQRQAAITDAERAVATSREEFERLGVLRNTRKTYMETQEKALDVAITALHNSTTLCNDLGASENALSVDILNNKIQFLKEMVEQHEARLDAVKGDNEATLVEMVEKRTTLVAAQELAQAHKDNADGELSAYDEKADELRELVEAGPDGDITVEVAKQQLEIVDACRPALQQKVADADKALERATEEVARLDATRVAIDAQQQDIAAAKVELEKAAAPLVEKAAEWQTKADKTLALEARRHQQAVDVLVVTPPGFAGKDVASPGGEALKAQMKQIADKLPLEDPQAEREMPRLAKLEIISRAVADVAGNDPARAARLMAELQSKPSQEWAPVPRPSTSAEEALDESRVPAPSADLRALFHKMADVPRGIELLNEIGAPEKASEQQAALEPAAKPKLDTMGRAQLAALHAYWKADKALATESDPAVKEWLGKAQKVATHTMRFDKKKPETAEFEGKEFVTEERVAYAAVSKGMLSNAAGSEFDKINKSLQKVGNEWLEAAKDTRSNYLRGLPRPTFRPYKNRTPFDRAMIKLANSQLEAQGMPSVKTAAHANIARIARTLSDKLAIGGKRSGPMADAAPRHAALERADTALADARRNLTGADELLEAHTEVASRARELAGAARARINTPEIEEEGAAQARDDAHAAATANFKLAGAKLAFAEASKTQRDAAAAAAKAERLAADAAQALAKAEQLAESAPSAAQAVAAALVSGTAPDLPANVARDTARADANRLAALAATAHEQARSALDAMDAARVALSAAHGELATPAAQPAPSTEEIETLDGQAQTAAGRRDEALTRQTGAAQALAQAETGRNEAAQALAAPSREEREAIRFDAAAQVVCDYIARQKNEATKVEPLTAELPNKFLQRSTTEFQRASRLYKAELGKRDIEAMRLELQARFAKFDQERGKAPPAGQANGGRAAPEPLPEPFETMFREVETAPSGIRTMLGQTTRPPALTPQRVLTEISNHIDVLDDRAKQSLQWDTLKAELAVDQVAESVTIARRKQFDSPEQVVDFYKPMLKELRLRNQLIMTAGGEMGVGVPLLPVSVATGGILNLNANLFSYKKEASFQIKSPTYGLELVIGDTTTKTGDLKVTGGYNGVELGPIRLTTPSGSVKGDLNRGKSTFTTLRILRGKDDKGVREEQKARDAGAELLNTVLRWNEDGQHPVPGQHFSGPLEAVLAKHPDVLVANGSKELAGHGLTGDLSLAFRGGVGHGAFSAGAGATLSGKAEWAKEVSKERSGYAHQVVNDRSSQFRTRLNLAFNLGGINGVPQARVALDGKDPDNGATRFYGPLNFADFSRELAYRLEKNGATRFAIGDQTGGSLDRAYGSAKEVLAEIDNHQEEFYMRFLETVAAEKGTERDTEENRHLAAIQLSQFKRDLAEASKHPNLQFNIKYEMQPRMSGWIDGHNALETLAVQSGDVALANQQREARGRLVESSSTWSFKNCAIRNKGKDSSDLGIDFIWRRSAKRSAETSSAVSAFPA
jgi:hypothetical protein